MARQANGTYLQPANTAAVSGQTISSTAFNTLITDVGTEITNSVDRGGRSAMTAALPMGGQKITGMAEPTVSTDGATKNYVDTTTAAFFSTGDIKPTLKTVADAGWIFGGANTTIGNAGSGATYANANAQALYTLIWNSISSPTANAYCPVSTGLGASAAADWAGLKPLSTGFWTSHALGIAGSGGALTTRVLGSDTRSESSNLTAANIPTITSTNAAQSITVTTTQKVVNGPNAGSAVAGGSQVTAADPGSGGALSVVNSTGSNSISTTYTNASPTAVSVMQPTIWVNVMIKL